jgi:hypothetical protein
MRSPVAIFLIGVGILLSFPVRCSAQWVQAGSPGSGWITALAVSGGNLFTGTRQGGVYLSQDNGVSWRAVNSGLPAETDVQCLAVSGTNLFAGTEEGEIWRLPLSEITNKK